MGDLGNDADLSAMKKQTNKTNKNKQRRKRKQNRKETMNGVFLVRIRCHI